MLQPDAPVVQAVADQEIVAGTPTRKAVAGASRLADGATTAGVVSVWTANV